MIRRFLDFLYRGSMVLAASSIAAIAVLVMLQVGARFLDRVLSAIGLPRTGFAVPSLAEIGAYLFVAASFLALAGTFRAGAHIRVTLIAKMMGPKRTRYVDIAVLILAFVIAAFISWHSWVQVVDSYTFGSLSYGVIKIPLALPQSAMAAGFTLLAIAILDDIVAMARGGEASFSANTASQKPAGGGH